MANKTISMLKLRQLFKLKNEGRSNREVGRMLCVHRETVRHYVNKAIQLGLSFSLLSGSEEADIGDLLGDMPAPKVNDEQRKEELQGYFPVVHKELSRVGVDRHAMWESYKQAFPQGYTYAHFCREYKRWCSWQEASGRMEHKAGDKLYMDFAGKKLAIYDRQTGQPHPVEVFVALLGFSQYTYVEGVASQKREPFIRSVENTFYYLGGVPRAIVPDNLKSAVYRGNKYEPELNEAFERFALHYGTTILPTRPGKPKDKALVEGAVKLVYKRIYAPLRDRIFYSLEELNTAIRELLIRYNDRKLTDLPDSRRSLLEEVERKELLPLPTDRYELCEYTWALVYKNGYIMLGADKHYYSVPYTLIGQKVKVVYNSVQVEIFYHLKRVALHRRSYSPKGYTTITDHLASTHRFVTEWSAERFMGWAGSIGSKTRELISQVIDSRPHPEQAYKSCMGILHLAKKVGNTRLEAACERALHYQNYSYKTILKILQAGLDQEPIQMEIDYRIGSHENIRGKSYYQ